jgi:hypothetical protein
MNTDPMQQSKEELASIVDHISVANSPVGIDAQLTHAIIISYLQQIVGRIDRIESEMARLPR